MKQSGQAGFTLVEVLIASAILVISMGVLLQLFSSGLDRLYQAGSSEHTVLVKQQILEGIRTSNPMLEARRAGEIEGVSFQWIASPYGLSYTMGTGEFSAKKIQMYRLVVTLSGKRNESFEVMRLGYRSVK